MPSHSVINVDCEAASCSYPEPHTHGFDCDVTCRTCEEYCLQFPLDNLVLVETEEIRNIHDGQTIGDAIYIDGELSEFEVDEKIAHKILAGTYKGLRLPQFINN